MDLRTYRKQQKLTQVQVAKALGITQVRVSEIENGEHPSGVLARRIVEWSRRAVTYDALFPLSEKRAA